MYGLSLSWPGYSYLMTSFDKIAHWNLEYRQAAYSSIMLKRHNKETSF